MHHTKKIISTMELLLFIILFAPTLSYYMIESCGATSLCSSTYGSIGLNKDGAFQFPVFHRKHPCVSSSTLMIHDLANDDVATESTPVIGNDKIHAGKFFIPISLGTPAVTNLVTIDTGSTLSWVVCQPCQIQCHPLSPEAGASFDPRGSTTYRWVGCRSRDCAAVQESLAANPFGCVEETDTCLYGLRYGSGRQYSAGRLGSDKLTLANGGVVDDGFVFGCSEDDSFNGREAGVVGFGNQSFSFFNQVARHASYRAFSYCFPGDHGAEGFLSIGPYADDEEEQVHTQMILPRFGERPVYSLQQIDMMIDGDRIQVDPSEYSKRMMVVDSGTEDTFLLAPVFEALVRAMAAAMRAKGFAAESTTLRTSTCFRRPTTGVSEPAVVDLGDLPTVEMKFTGSTLRLPPKNVFHGPSSSNGGEVCLAFSPDVSAGVRNVQIRGNRATRSFRVVHDLETMSFGFQPAAC